MKTINYKGKGEHSVNELALIIEQQAEELHLFKSGQKQLPIHDVVGRSEQLVCDCGNPNLTWYGNDDDKTYFCFECKKEVTN
jgi:hypothetical protein